MKKKQQKTSRYSIAALVVSLIGCLATGVLLLLRGTVGLGLYTPPSVDTLNRYVFIAMGVLVLGIAAYVLMEPKKVSRFLSGRQAKYGSNALVMSIAFFGILIVANALAYQNPDQLADATEDKTNTFVEETANTLEALPEKVTATAFYSTNLSTTSAEELLEKFKAASNGKFDYRFVNPDTDPVAAREAGITGDGKILLSMGGRQEVASFASETEITKALIRLIDPEPRAVYFLTGHGEATTESGEISMSLARETLEHKNYTIASLNLLGTNKVPEDALAIVIAGPLKPVSKQEVDLLKQYMEAGGSLVVMENPIPFTEFGNSADPLADYLASDWGITLEDNVIIDLSSQQPLYAVSDVDTYGIHPITANLTQQYLVIMPQARTIGIQGAIEGVIQTPLIFTTPNSWGEVSFVNAEGSQIAFDPEDLPGPLLMAAAGENINTKGRVVVFGNSFFATDEAFEAYGNGNFFVNAVDWAAEQENLIDLTPRVSRSRTFQPPQSQLYMILIILGVVIVLPGLVILSGIATWLQRRRQG